MKQFCESIISSKWHENKELQEKAEKVEKSDEAVQIYANLSKL